jgi:signal transduction histidine kinase
VAVIDGRVDGRPVAIDRPLVLPFDRNRLELRFAALSYRDPSLIRLQVRSGPEAPWTDLRGGATFHWVDLPPGAYRAEVRASLDGAGWTPVPAVFAFRVAPPWWRRPWALALFAAAVAGALAGLHRARVAVALRLERQRTRIAMDLHDQMGSALGTIGVLSGVLAEQEPAGERRRLAGEITATASELGAALSDIVWSLRPQPAALGELAARLAERGHRIFAGGGVDFEAELPEDPPAAPLPLAVRRAVLSIGLEALHNAARHARARRVSLALAPAGGGRWLLTVRDDGVGLPDEPAAGGMGIANMRRRAAEIGARLECARTPEGGTAVRLSFHPAGRRGGRRRASHDHATARTRPRGESPPRNPSS